MIYRVTHINVQRKRHKVYVMARSFDDCVRLVEREYGECLALSVFALRRLRFSTRRRRHA